MRKDSSTETVLDGWLAKLGQLIAQERISRGLTVYALAKAAGISRQQLSNLEAGQNTSVRLFGKILIAMELPWQTLLKADLTAAASKDFDRKGEITAAVDESIRHLGRAQKLLKVKDK